jgi:hypothetical protein
LQIILKGEYIIVSLIFGYVYLLFGCLCLITGIFIPNSMVGKIIIRSRKVLDTEKYIKIYKITNILVGIFAIFMGFTILKKGFGYTAILNLPFLLIMFIGGHYRDKLIIRS